MNCIHNCVHLDDSFGKIFGNIQNKIHKPLLSFKIRSILCVEHELVIYSIIYLLFSLNE